MFLTILTNFLLGVIGILLYTMWKSKHYFFDKDQVWSMPIFLAENVKAWIWSGSIVLLLAIVSGITADAGVFDVLKGLLGIDIENSEAGFITLGVLLNVTVKK